jgi:hypothetical protein
LDTERVNTIIIPDAALAASLRSEKMWRETREKFIPAGLAAVLATGLITVASGQGRVLPISPEEVEVQVRQEWKAGKPTCEAKNQSRIDRVDILNSDEFKKWLVTLHALYGDSTELLPKGNYVRVASSAEDNGDGITVFGPVYTTLKTTDFHSLVGLPICNYKGRKSTATQLKVDD